jgi:hypothetical protein
MGCPLKPLLRAQIARAIEVGGALNEPLGSAFSEERLQETMLLTAKLRNQTLKEMGCEPIRSDSENPNWERAIELFEKGGTSGVQFRRTAAKTNARHARTAKNHEDALRM